MHYYSIGILFVSLDRTNDAFIDQTKCSLAICLFPYAYWLSLYTCGIPPFKTRVVHTAKSSTCVYR
ncbi:Uncharacterized protein APZ42_031977 [Daphnia magna]|uniref:Uncharacterized protein n=1 Tax=Daphnia magna TaxID=35525 RepID=A0A0P5A2Q0_9CRUS|nr:Uncharacterized protein APZ42_031977 [Daphnia magna]